MAPKESTQCGNPAIQVREAGNNGEWSTWHISQNLTDRWGGFNYHNAAAKPLEPLEDSPELLERLRSQMWDEITFVTRKDGQPEFCSRSSSACGKAKRYIHDMTDDWYKRLLRTAKQLHACSVVSKPLHLNTQAFALLYHANLKSWKIVLPPGLLSRMVC